MDHEHSSSTEAYPCKRSLYFSHLNSINFMGEHYLIVGALYYTVTWKPDAFIFFLTYKTLLNCSLLNKLKKLVLV